MYYSQKEYNIKCEWGFNGLNSLLSYSDIIIIIDILSFSTCIDIVMSKNSTAYPYKYNDESSISFAKFINAELAKKRSKNEISLSPYSLLNLKENSKIVLPSPNGSELSLSTKNKTTFCACFRNYKAVAKKALELDENITIICAGERWGNSELRVSIEDLIGAGAVISELSGTLSPESKIALNSFNTYKNDLFSIIKESSSGKELIEKDFEDDVKLACQLNVSKHVPILSKEGFYYSL
ncbi:MAG: 2-phosphosulfolactate phosphatase [Cyanobacteriota bacterium]